MSIATPDTIVESVSTLETILLNEMLETPDDIACEAPEDFHRVYKDESQIWRASSGCTNCRLTSKDIIICIGCFRKVDANKAPGCAGLNWQAQKLTLEERLR